VRVTYTKTRRIFEKGGDPQGDPVRGKTNRSPLGRAGRAANQGKGGKELLNHVVDHNICLRGGEKVVYLREASHSRSPLNREIAPAKGWGKAEKKHGRRKEKDVANDLFEGGRYVTYPIEGKRRRLSEKGGKKMGESRGMMTVSLKKACRRRAFWNHEGEGGRQGEKRRGVIEKGEGRAWSKAHHRKRDLSGKKRMPSMQDSFDTGWLRTKPSDSAQKSARKGFDGSSLEVLEKGKNVPEKQIRRKRVYFVDRRTSKLVSSCTIAFAARGLWGERSVGGRREVRSHKVLLKNKQFLVIMGLLFSGGEKQLRFFH